MSGIVLRKRKTNNKQDKERQSAPHISVTKDELYCIFVVLYIPKRFFEEVSPFNFVFNIHMLLVLHQLWVLKKPKIKHAVQCCISYNLSLHFWKKETIKEVKMWKLIWNKSMVKSDGTYRHILCSAKCPITKSFDKSWLQCKKRSYTNTASYTHTGKKPLTSLTSTT